MVAGWAVVLSALVYLCCLFAVAHWGDRSGQRLMQGPARSTIYALALAVGAGLTPLMTRYVDKRRLMAWLMAGVGVVSSASTGTSTRGMPLRSSAVPGVGTVQTPWAIRT